MMDAKPYQITTEPARKLVSMSFDPMFWDEGVSQSFIRDCVGAVGALACNPKHHLILVDLRHAVLQSKDVYDRMLSLVAAATARRIALVASAPLARMQTKRLQIRGNVVMFDELSAAESWLFSHDESAATA